MGILSGDLVGVLFCQQFQLLHQTGIVFFTIALLPSLVGGQTKVFAAEATGPINNIDVDTLFSWQFFTL